LLGAVGKGRKKEGGEFTNLSQNPREKRREKKKRRFVISSFLSPRIRGGEGKKAGESYGEEKKGKKRGKKERGENPTISFSCYRALQKSTHRLKRRKGRGEKKKKDKEKKVSKGERVPPHIRP